MSKNGEKSTTWLERTIRRATTIRDPSANSTNPHYPWHNFRGKVTNASVGNKASNLEHFTMLTPFNRIGQPNSH